MDVWQLLDFAVTVALITGSAAIIISLVRDRRK